MNAQRLFPQQQQQQPPPPPPPPPPQPQLLQQQQQQQQQPPPQKPQININDLTHNIIQTVGPNPTDLNVLYENISKYLNNFSNKCMYNHSLINLPNDTNNELLTKIKENYREYYSTSLEKKGERVFKDFCSACTFFKLGLISDNIIRELKTFSCSTNSIGMNNSFMLGSFIHAFNPYKPDRPLKNIQSNHPSEKIAFPSGTLLIPTGKILLQLLALPQDVLAQGLKIIQIMSDEENINDIRKYYRFFERNKTLEPGYYKKGTTLDEMKKMNLEKGEDIYINDEQKDRILNIYQTLKNKSGGTFINIPTPSDESQFGIASDEDIKMENIFQNGEPLFHITRGQEAVDADKIGMKIFDLNPAFVSYLQSMINIQNHLENKTNNNNNNYYNYQSSYRRDTEDNTTHKMRSDYLSLWKPAAPILNSVYFDLLMLGFYNELNIENLVNIPPFNDKCVYTQQNILLINKNGNCIMTSGNENTNSVCSIFNKILRHSNIPFQQKIVATGFPQTVNDKGIPPKSSFPSNIINTIQSEVTPPNIEEIIKAKYNVIYDFHKHQSQNYHNNIKNNLDRLKNYFCQFKDDMGNDLQVKGNEVIFDIATRIFPQIVLQSTNNKNMHSLHFSEMAKTKPIVFEDPHPNCVFVNNLGFVNILNICDQVPLILKNAYVYLENLIKRDVEGYVNKTSDNCQFDSNANDNEDPTRTFTTINIMKIPQKRKIDSNSTIDLVGKGNNEFDYAAYMKTASCPQPNSFNDYVHKYGHNNDRHCPRKV